MCKQLSRTLLAGACTPPPPLQVEGLLNLIKDRLLETNPFAVAAGDGADPARSILFREFMDKMDDMIAGRAPFTLHIEDPMANSFVYSPFTPEVDPRLVVRVQLWSRRVRSPGCLFRALCTCVFM